MQACHSAQSTPGPAWPSARGLSRACQQQQRRGPAHKKQDRHTQNKGQLRNVTTEGRLSRRQDSSCPQCTLQQCTLSPAWGGASILHGSAQAHPAAVLQPHRQLVGHQASEGQLRPKEACCCQDDPGIRPGHTTVTQQHSSTAQHASATNGVHTWQSVARMRQPRMASTHGNMLQSHTEEPYWLLCVNCLAHLLCVRPSPAAGTATAQAVTPHTPDGCCWEQCCALLQWLHCLLQPPPLRCCCCPTHAFNHGCIVGTVSHHWE